MENVTDAEIIRAVDWLIKEVTQHVVQEALENGYTHGTVTAAFIAQAYTIMRLTLPVTPDERKAHFLAMAAALADKVESASRPRA